ncbi:MAG: hypothetical protein B5M54_00710 [Candidatus Aminicenantes bacterium 4484_214]|nr:MAG: hypothetical protein B5M54_00710 [Candidatus Aminicenantes bacterium 4484_214]RLE10469.1 MAG: hypothetical protein DRJ06_01140 [Candidatus Aminicenantes bacterium]
MERFRLLSVLGLGFFLIGSTFVFSLQAQGHIEFGFHYGTWNINLLKGMIEEGLSEALESDLKDEFLADIQEDYPTFREKYYDQSVSFDSGGHSFGLELRWYPGGENGSFSLGLGIEKTKMEVRIPTVSARLDVEDELTSEVGRFEGQASGRFLTEPFSFHLTFRWDILPSSVVHPYLTFGVGMAGGTAIEEAQVDYSYQGTLQVPGEPDETYSGAESESLKDIKDEMEQEGDEFFLPGFFPFVQLNLGLKAKIMPNIHALVDVGVFNGFLLKGGLAIRL